MSTRSAIALKISENSYEWIYSHWDGYLKGVGKTLKQHYDNVNKIKQLLDLGDISILGSEIGEKHDFEDRSNEKWTTAYGRDRGEKNVKKKTAKSLSDLVSKAERMGCEYVYVYDNGDWMVYDIYGDKELKRFSTIKHEIITKMNLKKAKKELYKIAKLIESRNINASSAKFELEIHPDPKSGYIEIAIFGELLDTDEIDLSDISEIEDITLIEREKFINKLKNNVSRRVNVTESDNWFFVNKRGKISYVAFVSIQVNDDSFSSVIDEIKKLKKSLSL